MIGSSPLLLLLYLCGLTGLVLCAGNFLQLQPTYYALILSFIAVVTTAFWVLYTRFGRVFVIVAAVSSVVSALLLVPQIYGVVTELKALAVSHRPVSELSLHPVFIIVLIYLIVFLFFTMEFVFRSHSILFLIGLGMLIVAAIYGFKLNQVGMILTGVFEIGFIVVNMTERRSGKNTLTVPERSRINIVSTLLTIAIAAVALIPSIAIEQQNESQLFDATYQADNFIRESIRKITNTPDTDQNNGRISRGNLYQTGKPEITVYTDQQPSGTLYLRGYTGSGYANGYWGDAFEYDGSQPITSDFFEFQEIPLKEHFINTTLASFFNGYSRRAGRSIPESFYYLISNTSDPISEMYYLIARDTVLKAHYFRLSESNDQVYLETPTSEEASGYVSNSAAANLYIAPMEGTVSTVYTPYFAQNSVARLVTDPRFMVEGYYHNSYLNYEQINASSRWEDNECYKLLRNSYEAIIQKEYTQLPSATQQRLKEYCEQTPLTDLNEITTYILVTLNNHATYTTTPGNTPPNKDVLDYFLFESGKGYCVHYASVATLMYRMYGIPARYVTGFAVQENSFEQGENALFPNNSHDTLYSAVVSDKYAHAWVEIFLEDYGWVPVEVTPTSTGTMAASYPGYNSGVMRTIMAKHDWHFRGEVGNARVASTASETSSFGGIPVFVWFLVPILLITAAIVFLMVRRRSIFRQLPVMSCRRLFDRIIRMLHYSGLLTGCTGSEKDFPQQLSKAVPAVSPDSASRLISILQAVNYADSEVSQDDRKFVEDFSRFLADELYDRLSPFKKPLFKFLYAFS